MTFDELLTSLQKDMFIYYSARRDKRMKPDAEGHQIPAYGQDKRMGNARRRIDAAIQEYMAFSDEDTL